MNKILNNVYFEEQIAEIAWKLSEFTQMVALAEYKEFMTSVQEDSVLMRM